MIKLNKWYRLVIILAIFALLVNLFSHRSQKKITEGFTSGTAEAKCTYSKDQAKKDIQKDKDNAQKNLNQCNKCQRENPKEGQCGKGCSDLLPVLDPMYNMREMCKQIILLEDHLFQKQKRCHDCICKHFLTIEALAEEAITLDKDHKYTEELGDIPQKVRSIAKKYIKNHEDHSQPAVTAQELRQIRKGVMQKCFKHF